MAIHNCLIKDLGDISIPEPAFGDLSLKVFPITHGKSVALPEPFKAWEPTVDKMLGCLPLQNGATGAFVTIDTKWFSTPERLRREGIHMDGNFCADPVFRSSSGQTMSGWGGGGTWSGLRALKDYEELDNSHVHMGFSIPYDLGVIPIGRYVSDHFGATIVATTLAGCDAWPGIYSGDVGEGGEWSSMEDQLGTPQVIPAGRIVAMTSNTPHQSQITPAGFRRTLVRITMPHNWDNRIVMG